MGFLHFLNGRVHIKFKGCHYGIFFIYTQKCTDNPVSIQLWPLMAVSDLGLYCLVNYIAYIHLSRCHYACDQILMKMLFCVVLFVNVP